MQNLILSALPDCEYMRFASTMADVALPAGRVLYEPGQRIDYIYFPTSAVVNLIYTTEDGATAEAWSAGNDGLIGIPAFLSSGTMPYRAVVQVAGRARRLCALVLQREFYRAGPLQHLLLRYTESIINQIGQIAICNRLHSFDQRLCRWLLLTQDRSRRDELLMTHDFIAMMLGGRRESITTAARRLQDGGFIDYSRGHIHILDRRGLEQRVCQCYAVIHAELERLFAPPERALNFA